MIAKFIIQRKYNKAKPEKNMRILIIGSNSFIGNHYKQNSWLKKIEEVCLIKHNPIGIRPLWKPMHLQPVFINFPFYLNSVLEEIFNKDLCLPPGSNLSSKDKILIEE